MVADTATPPSVLQSLERIPGARIEVVEYTGEFNFSEKINRGAIRANGDLLLLLNDDIEARSPDVVATMVAIAQQPDVGMVGRQAALPGRHAAARWPRVHRQPAPHPLPGAR